MDAHGKQSGRRIGRQETERGNACVDGGRKPPPLGLRSGSRERTYGESEGRPRATGRSEMQGHQERINQEGSPPPPCGSARAFSSHRWSRDYRKPAFGSRLTMSGLKVEKNRALRRTGIVATRPPRIWRIPLRRMAAEFPHWDRPEDPGHLRSLSSRQRPASGIPTGFRAASIEIRRGGLNPFRFQKHSPPECASGCNSDLETRPSLSMPGPGRWRGCLRGCPSSRRGPFRGYGAQSRYLISRYGV